MSDKTQTNQNYGGTVGIMGVQSGGSFTQNVGGPDFAKLADQLTKLEAAMAGAAIVNPELASSADHVAEARQAAADKSESKVVSSLKAAGKTALDFAVKFGDKVAVDVVVAWMKQSLGVA